MGLGEAIHDFLPSDGLGLVERGLNLLLHGREHGQPLVLRVLHYSPSPIIRASSVITS